jgi:phenylacetate-coenzyme A ligase PaaK-like adenylate-forming protein
MFDLNNIIGVSPFSMDAKSKSELFLEAMNSLTKYHYEHCGKYKQILDLLEHDTTSVSPIIDLPAIPVRLFKQYELFSGQKSEIFKTMTSSGTTGQAVSKILLDRKNATNQTKVLAKIVSSLIGKKRLPMLVIDTSSVTKNRNLFSARGAGVLGFSVLGTDVTYALDENMQLNFEEVEKFCLKYKDQPTMLFGFTYIIWEHFYKALSRQGKKFLLEKAIMLHGGGWKKMIDQAVDKNEFKQQLHSVCGIKNIHNYFGMVEQTGSIFIECQEGNLHCSIFSDVILRRSDFTVCDIKEEGMIQLLSLLPSSYPGHILLTEDSGAILGLDDCPCGRLGKYFEIYGRISNAEIRGCSDTYDAA